MVLSPSSISLCKSAHLCLSVWNEDCLVFHAFFCHLFVLKTFITVVQIRWWSLISCASKSFLGTHNYIRNLECLFWCSRIVRRLHYHFYISMLLQNMKCVLLLYIKMGRNSAFLNLFFFLVYHFFWTFCSPFWLYSSIVQYGIWKIS